MEKLYSLATIFMISALLLPVNLVRAERHPLIGAQISVLETDNLTSCEAYFKELKKLGYNTIILRVFHNRGDRFHELIKESTRKLKPEGVYFNTEQVPVIADILTPACKCAHRSDMKIFAWMNTLKSDYNHKLKDKVLTCSKKTCKIEPENNLLDPAAAENIDFLKQLFADLASHPIDGILLQDDLMLRHNQGFKLVNNKISPTPDKLYNFNPKNHIQIESYKPYFKQWREQQALTLQTLANQIFSACHRLKPNLICAQNVHYEILYNQKWGRDWFAWTKNALETSTADYLMIMTYQERMREELELKSDSELATEMDKIFAKALDWQLRKPEIVFKFTTSPQTSSQKQRKNLLTTLHNTITIARQKNWANLVLTPCNNLTAARAIVY